MLIFTRVAKLRKITSPHLSPHVPKTSLKLHSPSCILESYTIKQFQMKLAIQVTLFWCLSLSSLYSQNRSKSWNEETYESKADDFIRSSFICFRTACVSILLRKDKLHFSSQIEQKSYVLLRFINFYQGMINYLAKNNGTYTIS